MNSENVDVCKARLIFDRLRPSMELTHMNEFIAIEPTSGDHFLGWTLSEAIQTARSIYPDRLCHAFRIGHQAAIHIGGTWR